MSRISVNKSPHIRFLGTKCGLVARFSLRLLYFLANKLPSEGGLATETHRTALRVNELLNHGTALVIQRFSTLPDTLRAVRVGHGLKPNVWSELKAGGSTAHHVTPAASGHVSF